MLVILAGAAGGYAYVQKLKAAPANIINININLILNI